jgi:hypothetical protein
MLLFRDFGAVPTVYYLPWSESITGFPRFLGPLPTPASAVGRVPMHLPPGIAASEPLFSFSILLQILLYKKKISRHIKISANA